MATTRSAIDRSSHSSGSRRRTRVLAVVGAALATLAVWVVADPLAGVELTVRQGSGASLQEVGPAAVLLVTVLAGLAGWALLAFLERRSSQAGRTWTVIALVALVLSLTSPLLAGTTTASKAALAGMHLAAAAVLVPLLARSARA
jgi:hypothetical protein